jgi:hypothetical protein
MSWRKSALVQLEIFRSAQALRRCPSSIPPNFVAGFAINLSSPSIPQASPLLTFCFEPYDSGITTATDHTGAEDTQQFSNAYFLHTEPTQQPQTVAAKSAHRLSCCLGRLLAGLQCPLQMILVQHRQQSRASKLSWRPGSFRKQSQIQSPNSIPDP